MLQKSIKLYLGFTIQLMIYTQDPMIWIISTSSLQWHNNSSFEVIMLAYVLNDSPVKHIRDANVHYISQLESDAMFGSTYVYTGMNSYLRRKCD